MIQRKVKNRNYIGVQLNKSSNPRQHRYKACCKPATRCQNQKQKYTEKVISFQSNMSLKIGKSDNFSNDSERKLQDVYEA